MQESFVDSSNYALNKFNNGYLWEADIRSKFLITVLTSTAVIMLSSIYAQLVLFVCSFIYMLSMRQYKLTAVTYTFVFIIMTVALISLFIINIFVNFMEGRSYFAVMVPFMRMATMVNVVLPLAFTSRVQSMLTALKSLRLPVFIYLPIAVMIRFIPTFTSDIKQIVEALTIRGIEVSVKSFIKHPVLMGRYMVVPLLFRSLRASEELGIAAELKGLGVNNSVKPYKKLSWGSMDTLMVMVCTGVIILSVLVQTNIEVPVELRSLHR